MSRLTRDGTAEPVSRDQILRYERGKGNNHFPCSADLDEQDWQLYPVDPYSCYMCNHTFSGANGDREMPIFLVQVTTSRIGNLSRLICTTLYVMVIHTVPHEAYRDDGKSREA